MAGNVADGANRIPVNTGACTKLSKADCLLVFQQGLSLPLYGGKNGLWFIGLYRLGVKLINKWRMERMLIDSRQPVMDVGTKLEDLLLNRHSRDRA